MNFTRSGQFLWLLSMLIAVGFWSMVKYEQNWQERDFRLPVVTHGLGVGMAVEQDLNDYVSVTVYAPKKMLDSLGEQIKENEQEYAAALDLSNAPQGEEVQVRYRQSLEEKAGFSGLKVRRISPEKQVLRLVQEQEKVFEIQKEVTGFLAGDVQLEDWFVAPETVHLIGSRTNLEKVAQVRCVLDLDDISSDTIETRQPEQLLDIIGHDGERLPMAVVRISETSLELNVRVSESSASWQVPVRIVTDGNPADGYMLGNKLQTDPLTVTLTGDKRLKQLVREIFTEPVNVSLRRADEVNQPDVALDLSPEKFNIDPAELDNLGLTADDLSELSADPSTVEVTFSVVRRPSPPAQKTYRVQVVVNIIPNTAGLTATVEPQFVDVVLQGPLSVLDSTQALIGEVEGARTDSARFVSLSINLNAEQYGVGTYSFGQGDAAMVIAKPGGTSVVSVMPMRVQVEVKSTGGNQ